MYISVYMYLYLYLYMSPNMSPNMSYLVSVEDELAQLKTLREALDPRDVVALCNKQIECSLVHTGHEGSGVKG